MVSRLINNDADLKLLVQYLWARKRPYSVDVTAGKRTNPQNHLQQMWVSEVASQLGDRTAEEVRGYCKLHFGVPILRAENEKFREVYDRLIRPLGYNEKLEIMMVPMDLPVTRIMSVDQKTRYLDAMSQHWLEQGIVLTDPKPRERRAA